MAMRFPLEPDAVTRAAIAEEQTEQPETELYLCTFCNQEKPADAFQPSAIRAHAERMERKLPVYCSACSARKSKCVRMKKKQFADIPWKNGFGRWVHSTSTGTTS